MKFIIFIAVAIVAVSGKSLNVEQVFRNPEFISNLEEMKREMGDIQKKLQTDPEAAVNVLNFMIAIDKPTRSLIFKDSANTINVIADSTKSFEQKFQEVAGISQNSANLWKLAEKNYNELHHSSAPVESNAVPAA